MIKFGPSGNSLAFSLAGNSKTEQTPKWLKDMGLDCFEYSFGRGVNISDEKAESIGKIFREYDIEISVHAPYYINLANPNEEMVEKSYGYIIDSAKKAKKFGSKRVIFHPASQGRMKREEAVELTKKRLEILRDKIYLEKLDDIIYCPETMGKSAQIGTIEEITYFCETDKIFIPAVDFGHVNARECGSLKTKDDFKNRLVYMIEKLGFEKMEHFHIHFSKIEYTAKGEVRHLTFEDTQYGPEFAPLAEALKELELKPYVICESAGTQDIDAREMKRLYFL